MKYLCIALTLVSFPCLAQEKAKTGFVGHKDCRVYFLSDRFIYNYLPDPPLETLARMTDAEKEQWRKTSVRHWVEEDLTSDDEKWWAKRAYKKYPGLCYVPHSYLNDQRNSALNGPLFAIYFTEDHASHVEKQMKSETSTQDVPVKGQATVYDEYGQNIGTADVRGTATVETTSTYPVKVRINSKDVAASVWRIAPGGSPQDMFTVFKSRRQGDSGMAGLIEAFRRDPRKNGFQDCLKFLMLETGLEMNGKR